MCEGGGAPELRIISGILHARVRKKKNPGIFSRIRPNLENTQIFFLMNPSLSYLTEIYDNGTFS